MPASAYTLAMASIKDRQRISAHDAEAQFGGVLDAAQSGPVTIERDGEPVAVVLSAGDYRDFEAQRLARLRGDISLGLDDLAAGRTVDRDTAFDALRSRLSG